MRIVGIDPGPKPGICVLDLEWGKIYAVTWAGDVWKPDAFEADVIAVEDFTIGHRTAKASAQQASKETIGQLEFLRHYCRTTPGVMIAQNTPASVKAFVTDKKLRAYNLYDQAPSKHHRDAARHAVYVAIRLGKLSLDPVKDIRQGEKRR